MSHSKLAQPAGPSSPHRTGAQLFWRPKKDPRQSSQPDTGDNGFPSVAEAQARTAASKTSSISGPQRCELFAFPLWRSNQAHKLTDPSPVIVSIGAWTHKISNQMILARMRRPMSAFEGFCHRRPPQCRATLCSFQPNGQNLLVSRWFRPWRSSRELGLARPTCFVELTCDSRLLMHNRRRSRLIFNGMRFYDASRAKGTVGHHKETKVCRPFPSVRFWPLTDIGDCTAHVRFRGQSGDRATELLSSRGDIHMGDSGSEPPTIGPFKVSD
jgi:hypothetical protein